MALSGSFYTNVNKHWRLQLEWSASQNVSKNTSTVTAKLYWISLDSYGVINSSVSKDGYITIDGTKYTFSGSGLAKLSGNQKKLLKTASKTITHDSDGTKSFSLDGSFSPEVTLGSTWYGTVDLTAHTYSLNTIPRKSTLSTSASFTAGSDYTITVSRASSSFTHRAYIDVQDNSGNWQNIKKVDFSSSQTSRNSSFTTDEKTAIFKYLNGRSSMPTRINLRTYSGGDDLGINTYSGTVSVPKASTATITNPANVSEASGQGASTVFIDQSISISLTRYDSEFTHTLEFKDGNSGTVVHKVTGVGTSYTWTPTQDEKDALYSKIPNDIEFDGQLDVTTYYNGVLVRNSTNKDINYRVRNSNPVFSATVINYEDTNTSTLAVTGDSSKIIQKLSPIKVTLPQSSKAVAQNKASMIQYIAVLGEQEVTANYSDGDVTFTFNPLDAKVDQTVTIKAIDSRGFQSQISRSITMVPYSSPVVNGTAKRKNGFDNDTSILATGSISALMINGTQKNTLKSVKYHYRKTAEPATVSTWANWSTLTATLSGTTYTTTVTHLDLDYTSSFYLEFQVTDAFQTKTYQMTVSQGKPIMFMDAIKRTIGMGKFSTDYLLDVGGNANFDGILNVKGQYSILNGLDLNNFDLKNVAKGIFNVLSVTTDANISGNVTVGGYVELPTNFYHSSGGGLRLNNSDIVGANNIVFNDPSNSNSEGLQFPKTGTATGDTDLTHNYDSFRVLDGMGYLNGNPVFTSNDRILWSGSYYLTNSQTVTPKMKIQDCPNGWILVWSDYDPGVGPNNSDWFYCPIPKEHVTYTGGGIQLVIGRYDLSFVTKYVYINSDGTMTGTAGNGSSDGNRDDVCLRYVIAF